jgi:hypothetical protein
VVLCAMRFGELMSRANVSFMRICMGWFCECMSVYCVTMIVLFCFSHLLVYYCVCLGRRRNFILCHYTALSGVVDFLHDIFCFPILMCISQNMRGQNSVLPVVFYTPYMFLVPDVYVSVRFDLFKICDSLYTLIYICPCDRILRLWVFSEVYFRLHLSVLKMFLYCSF